MTIGPHVDESVVMRILYDRFAARSTHVTVTKENEDASTAPC
jgi:hypothetical protein